MVHSGQGTPGKRERPELQLESLAVLPPQVQWVQLFLPLPRIASEGELEPWAWVEAVELQV